MEDIVNTLRSSIHQYKAQYSFLLKIWTMVMQVVMKFYGTEILESVNSAIQFNGIVEEPTVSSFNHIHSNFFLSI